MGKLKFRHDRLTRTRAYFKAHRVDYTTLLLLTGLLAFFTTKTMNTITPVEKGGRVPAASRNQ